MIQDFTLSKSKSSLHPAKTALLLLFVALAGAPAAQAQQHPVSPGGIVVEMRGSSLINLDRNGSEIGYPCNPEGGGGPVASPIDINDLMVIPPRKMHLEHEALTWINDRGTAKAQVKGFCTETNQVFTNVCGERFRVKAKAVPSSATGNLELFAWTDTGGGTFLLELPLQLEITSTSLDDPDRVFVDLLTLKLKSSGRFSRENLPGGLDLSEPLPIDVDCDGEPEEELPASSGLYLGIDQGREAPFCLTEFGASICLGPAKTYATPGGGTGATAK